LLSKTFTGHGLPGTFLGALEGVSWLVLPLGFGSLYPRLADIFNEGSYEPAKMLEMLTKERTYEKYGEDSRGKNATERVANISGKVDPNSPLAQRLGEEELVMRFVWWLVTQIGVSPETASEYASTVNAWHRRWTGIGLAGGLPLHRVPQVVKGLRDMLGPKPPKRDRRGVRPQLLRRAIDDHLLKDLRMSTALRANWAALLETGLVGTLRGAEVATSAFDPALHVTRADVARYRGSEPHTVVYARNVKAKGPSRLQKLPVFLPADGEFLDPHRAIGRLFEQDYVPESQWATTPLFRDPATGKALTVPQLREMVRYLMYMIGLDGSFYGAHSLRIGGATAMFKKKATPLQIKTQGRWGSDIYMIYIERCRLQSMALSRAACSTSVEPEEADFLGVDDMEEDE
jgi:hypothetical protein